MNYTFQTYAFVLPNVVKTAQDHFNCSEIHEVDIEEAGSLASAINHFDELFLNEEIMTPLLNGYDDTLSKFTLALLKDTGWYDIDCTKMEDLKYGKNAGCVLPLKGCYNYMKSQITKNLSIAPFCNKIQSAGDVLECNPDGQSYGLCNLIRYSSVNPKYQYFNHIIGTVVTSLYNYTGSNMFNEFCPVKVSGTNPNYNCRDQFNSGRSNSRIWNLNEYGDSSKCFRTILQNETTKLFGASCLKVNCSENNSSDLYVNTNMVNCPMGSNINVTYDYNKTAIINCGNYQ